MTPFASGKRWTLYGGDCLDVLAAGLIPSDAAVITDPPYGMRLNPDSKRFTGGSYSRETGRGAHARGRVGIMGKRRRVANDDQPFDPSPWLPFERVVLWGSNHFSARLPVGTTLVWIKRFPDAFGTFLSDAEIAWSRGGVGVYCHLQSNQAVLPSERAHPCQKPVELLSWCIVRAKADDLVVDPYAGVASCGVAALALGRRYIGCEIDPEYLPVAARRLAQAELDGVQAALIRPVENDGQQLGMFGAAS